MQEHHSILYGPFNALWHRLGGHAEVPDHIVMSVFVVTVLLAVFIPVGLSLREEKPGRFQVMLEQLVGGLHGMIEAQVGHGAGDRYLAVIGAFTLFIFFSNATGLFFFFTPPTSNPNVTFGLAGISFVLYNVIGIRKHGFGYIKHFLGPIWWLAPLMVVIETISHLVRPMSLSIRLMANMTADHLVVATFLMLGAMLWHAIIPGHYGEFGVLLPVPMLILGFVVVLVQTAVFCMLSTVYIAMAIEHAEEH